MAKLKVLIADENPSDLRAARKALADAGMEVTTVHSGELALKNFAELRPDVVLLSASIPNPDGFTVCKQIKSSARAHVPVVISIANWQPDTETGFAKGWSTRWTRKRGEKAKADAIIGKPFDAVDLTHVVSLLTDGILETKIPPTRQRPPSPPPEEPKPLAEGWSSWLPPPPEEESASTAAVEQLETSAVIETPGPTELPETDLSQAEPAGAPATVLAEAAVPVEIIEPVETFAGAESNVPPVELPEAADLSQTAAPSMPDAVLSADTVLAEVVEPVETLAGAESNVPPVQLPEAADWSQPVPLAVPEPALTEVVEPLETPAVVETGGPPVELPEAEPPSVSISTAPQVDLLEGDLYQGSPSGEPQEAIEEKELAATGEELEAAPGTESIAALAELRESDLYQTMEVETFGPAEEMLAEPGESITLPGEFAEDELYQQGHSGARETVDNEQDLAAADEAPETLPIAPSTAPPVELAETALPPALSFSGDTPQIELPESPLSPGSPSGEPQALTGDRAPASEAIQTAPGASATAPLPELPETDLSPQTADIAPAVVEESAIATGGESLAAQPVAEPGGAPELPKTALSEASSGASAEEILEASEAEPPEGSTLTGPQSRAVPSAPSVGGFDNANAPLSWQFEAAAQIRREPFPAVSAAVLEPPALSIASETHLQEPVTAPAELPVPEPAEFALFNAVLSLRNSSSQESAEQASESAAENQAARDAAQQADEATAMLQRLRLSALQSAAEPAFTANNLELDLDKFLALDPLFGAGAPVPAASEEITPREKATPVSETIPVPDLDLTSFLELNNLNEESIPAASPAPGGAVKDEAVAEQLVQRALESIRPSLLAEAKRLLRHS